MTMMIRSVVAAIGAELRQLRGPVVRVAAWTGGSIVVLVTLGLVVVFHEGGSGWVSAILGAISDGLLVGAVGVGGFMISAPRCPRCRRWREVAYGAGGQDMCWPCWREITSRDAGRDEHPPNSLQF